MVYADDTTLVCKNLNDLRKCIELIENYSNLYDIIINAQKAKCMIFGTITSVVEPEIKVNQLSIEIVEVFKFLGVNVDREGTFKKHLNIRCPQR